MGIKRPLAASFIGVATITSLLVATPSGSLAASTPTLKKISNTKAYDGGLAAIRTRYSKASGYDVSSATVKATQGKKIIASGKSIRLKAGKYKLTQTLKFKKFTWTSATSTMNARNFNVWNAHINDDNFNDTRYSCKILSATPIDIDGYQTDFSYKVSCYLPSISTKRVTGTYYDKYIQLYEVGETSQILENVSLDKQTVTRQTKKYGKTVTRTKKQDLTVKAKNRSCLTYKEMRKLKIGMTKSTAHKIIGGAGSRVSISSNYELREYDWCDYYDSYFIGYSGGRIEYMAD